MLSFYMTPGSCSTGIHILLEELELVFSAQVLNLLSGQAQSSEFLALNPKGTIPVLVRDDGTALTDFVAIAWWLACAYPKAKLLPDSLDEQAELLNIMNDIVSGIHAQGFARIFTPERFMLRETDQDAIEHLGKQIVNKGFAIVAKRLECSRGYLFERFSIADAALFYVEFWAQRINLDLPDVCSSHLQLMQSRQVVRRVLAEEGYRVR